MMTDIQQQRSMIAAEEARRAECRAGTRPWKIPPGTDPRIPDGIAGMIPEEAEQLARFNASCDLLVLEGKLSPPRRSI